MKLSGACHCGQVTYEIRGEPVRMAQCHCNACRRTTGTGHNVQAFFRQEQVDISGQTKSHETISDSGNIRVRHFCSTCGSRLFSENSGAPEMIGVAAGSFDNSDWFRPQAVLYTSERQDWDPLDPAIKSFEKMPPT